MGTRLKYIAMRLSAIDTENIEVRYMKKFQSWLFKNSHEKKYLSNDEFNHIVFNEKTGKIINAEFSSKTKQGIELAEKQFIEHELNQLSKLDYNKLKTDQKATFNFYKEFLESNPTGNVVQEFRQDIFKNQFAFRVFNNLHDEYKEDSNILVNYSAIYRLMVEDGLIRATFKPQMFIKFLSEEPFGICIDHQLKTLGRIGEKNVVRKNYKHIKQSINTKKNRP